MLAALVIISVLIAVSFIVPSFDMTDIDTSVHLCDDCPNACSCSFYVRDSECLIESDEMHE